jgi:hypothetical protein
MRPSRARRERAPQRGLARTGGADNEDSLHWTPVTVRHGVPFHLHARGGAEAIERVLDAQGYVRGEARDRRSRGRRDREQDAGRASARGRHRRRRRWLPRAMTTGSPNTLRRVGAGSRPRSRSTRGGAADAPSGDGGVPRQGAGARAPGVGGVLERGSGRGELIPPRHSAGVASVVARGVARCEEGARTHRSWIARDVIRGYRSTKPGAAGR